MMISRVRENGGPRLGASSKMDDEQCRGAACIQHPIHTFRGTGNPTLLYLSSYKTDREVTVNGPACEYPSDAAPFPTYPSALPSTERVRVTPLRIMTVTAV